MTDFKLTPADFRSMGQVESLYMAAEMFQNSKVESLDPKAVATLLLQLADEICSVDSVRAYKLAHAPGLAQEFAAAVHGVQ